jgi:regulator of replication initiation timing
MDLVPRIRQPTPEKRDKMKMTPRDCDGCQKYQDKIKEVIEENTMLKIELEKVHSQMQMLRV